MLGQHGPTAHHGRRMPAADLGDEQPLAADPSLGAHVEASVRRALKRGGGGSGGGLGSNPLLSAAEFGYDPRDQMAIEREILIENSERAAIVGAFPLIWLLFGLGFLIQAIILMDKVAMPWPGLSTLLLSVKSTLRGELLIFMALFLCYMGTYW